MVALCIKLCEVLYSRGGVYVHKGHGEANPARNVSLQGTFRNIITGILHHENNPYIKYINNSSMKVWPSLKSSIINGAVF